MTVVRGGGLVVGVNDGCEGWGFGGRRDECAAYGKKWSYFTVTACEGVVSISLCIQL